MVKHSRRTLVTTVGSLVLAPGILSLPVTANPVEAAPAGAVNALFVVADVVGGAKNVPPELDAERHCVNASRFPRNSQMVWRARVYDPETGEEMDDSQMESVQIRLGNGQNVPMRFAGHGDPKIFFWTGSFAIPKDFPTGTLMYSVVAQATDGRVGEFSPLAMAPSLLFILEEVLPDL